MLVVLIRLHASQCCFMNGTSGAACRPLVRAILFHENAGRRFSGFARAPAQAGSPAAMICIFCPPAQMLLVYVQSLFPLSSSRPACPQFDAVLQHFNIHLFYLHQPFVFKFPPPPLMTCLRALFLTFCQVKFIEVLVRGACSIMWSILM